MERMHGRGWKSSGCFSHYNLDVPIIELMDARTEIYLLSIGILGVSFHGGLAWPAAQIGVSVVASQWGGGYEWPPG